MILASLSGFFGTIWWTALVAVVSFALGVGMSARIKAFLGRG